MIDPTMQPQGQQGAMPPAQDSQQAQPDQAMPEQEAAQGSDLFGEEQEATPEEQDTYNRVVGRAYQLIYDEKMFPKILEQLKGGGNPPEGLARTAAMVVAKIAAAVNEKADQVGVSPEIAFNAGKEIFEDLAELSKRAGIKDYSQDPDAFEGAFFSALDQYRIMAQEAGDVKPETFQDDFAKLKAMDEDGSLEGRIQGLAQRDASRMKVQGAPGEETQPQSGLMPNKGGM